jgi:polysaccharide deacetylase 2 family uncharacterized protein YibQ
MGFGVLLFANSLLLQEHAEPPVPPPTLHSDWAADFPSRVERVTVAVEALRLPLPTPTEERKGSGALHWWHRHYELTVPAPGKAGAIDHLLEPVRTAAPGVTAEVNENEAGAQVQIGIDGLLTHTIVLHWLGRRPRAAIIIDDLGNDLLIAGQFVEIPAPLTFAVMPFRPFSKEVAERAALVGREVLVHLPMEAENGADFGAQDVLQVAADRGTILHDVDASLAAIPHAVGVNTHMGSRFTADRDRMQWVLERLKAKGLFFIDSRTSPLSVACEVAASISLPCANRTLFLDDTDDESAITTQLHALTELARTRGDVIAIGHPRPATLAALQTALPGFAAAGVDVVPASTIVAAQSLSRR